MAKKVPSPAAPQKKGALKRTDASLTETAYEAIKKAILSNNLRAGEPLLKERLIKEMGLTRTPLREAILRLEREGLVEVRPRMGTFVCYFNLKEIREKYEVRGALEGLAARLAATRLVPEQLAALEQSLSSFDLAGGVDYPAMSKAGEQLHRFIVDTCGNSVLAKMIRSLQDHFTRFRMVSLRLPAKILTSHRQHLEIVAALKMQDGEVAERLVRAHFEQAKRSLVESLMDHSLDSVDLTFTTD